MFRKLSIIAAAVIAMSLPDVSVAEQHQGGDGGGHQGGGGGNHGGGGRSGGGARSAGPSVARSSGSNQGRSIGANSHRQSAASAPQQRQRVQQSTRVRDGGNGERRAGNRRGGDGNGRHYSHRRHHWQGRWWNYGVGSCWAYDTRYDEYYWTCDDDD